MQHLNMLYVMVWIVSFTKIMNAALIPSVTVFRDRASKEVIKVNWGNKDGALIQYGMCLYKKRHQGYECTEEKKTCEDVVQKVAPKERNPRRNQTSWYLGLRCLASTTVEKLICIV